jgi:tRNA A-37 threonylcarbamoyl transferase component Bud32
MTSTTNDYFSSFATPTNTPNSMTSTTHDYFSARATPTNTPTSMTPTTNDYFSSFATPTNKSNQNGVKSILFDNNNPIRVEGPSNYELSNDFTLNDLITIIDKEPTMTKIDNSHFTIKRLGEGAFGESFLVTFDNSKSYVLKRLRKKIANRSKNTFTYKNTDRNISFSDTLYELEMLIKVKGKLWAVQLEAAQWDKSKNYFYLLYEYVPGMTLLDYYNTDYRKNINNPDKIARKKEIVNGVLYAIQQLHILGITHGDIKPENIFIPNKDTKRAPFLLDFGHANLTNSSSPIRSRMRNYKKLYNTIIKRDEMPRGLNPELIEKLRTMTEIKNNEYIKESFGGSTRKRRKIKKYRHTRSKRKLIR